MTWKAKKQEPEEKPEGRDYNFWDESQKRQRPGREILSKRWAAQYTSVYEVVENAEIMRCIVELFKDFSRKKEGGDWEEKAYQWIFSDASEEVPLEFKAWVFSALEEKE